MESAMLVWSQGYEGFSRGVQEKNKLQRMLNKTGLISMQFFMVKGAVPIKRKERNCHFTCTTYEAPLGVLGIRDNGQNNFGDTG